MSLRDEIRQELERRKQELEGRQTAIRSDRRRESGALDADWEEQAVELENAEVLDSLDQQGAAELENIRAALDRIDDPGFGTCSACGDPIAPERLRAVPTTSLCRPCADR